jgi:UDP-N-acetylmuramoyl-L-alanyl-D-glutamate--2,6-diaminopimelate ligase
MTQSLASIRAALHGAGLLVAERGALPETITGIADDSRAVAAGALFLAVRGAERDGHDYLAAAAEKGATAAVVDDPSRTSLPALVVSDTRRAAAVAATAYFDEPARSLRLVGVTGTNGKTTTVGMLRHLLDEVDARAASIGTLGVLVGGEGEPLDGGSGLTTPGPVELQRVLRALHDRGVRTVAMETSSHALHQRRVEGLEFEAAVFTNLTRDHLDYHGTMEAYFEAKSLLVAHLAPDGVAVINADDPAWESLPRTKRTVHFGTTRAAGVHAADIRCTPDGSRFSLVFDGQPHEVALPMIGDFNVANALAALAVAHALGLDLHDAARSLASAEQVPGRFESIDEGQPFGVIVDYAHTPDSLENVLGAARRLTGGQVISVFGCGGDRDTEKRPLMGRAGADLSDIAVVTSDNPRSEDPDAIIEQIRAGIPDAPHAEVLVDADRRAAIASALRRAEQGDIVVIAGKGHEQGQEFEDGRKIPFDDRDVARDELRKLKTGSAT